MVMNRRIFVRTFVLFLTILIFSGCIKKLQTNSAIKAIKKNLAKADYYHARDYIPSKYQEIVNELNQIQADANAQNYKAAYEKAKITKEKSKALVQEARKAMADDYINKARKKKRIAEINQGRTIDNDLFNKIIKNLALAEEYYRKQKLDKVIKTSEQVIKDTDTLLEKLVYEANTKYKDLETKDQELKTIGAETYASAFLASYEKLMADMKKYIEDENNYINALVTYNKAIKQYEDTKKETYRGISSEIITTAEQKLRLAQEKGAEVLAPTEYNSTNNHFAELLKDFINGNYEVIVREKDIFYSQLNNLIKLTIQRSAKREVEKLKNGIENLRDNGADKYLADMMQKADEIYKNATDLFKKDKWEEAEKTAKEGEKYLEKINAEFKNIAIAALNEAIARISAAEDAGAITFAFGSLKVAKDLFKQGQDFLESGEYDAAIRYAKETAVQADFAKAEAYKQRARQELVFISEDVQRKISQGIKLYSPQELTEVQNLIKKIQDLVNKGKYEKAVEVAQIAKAKLSLGLQNVISKANKTLKAAQKNIDLAEKYKANKYFPQKLSETKALFTKANVLFKQEKYKDAIEVGEKVIKDAKNLEMQSTKNWTLDELKVADTYINDAKNAGADKYATELMKNAVNAYVNSKKSLNTGEYKTALQLAFNSQNYAKQAKVFMVTDTERLISEAKKYLANTYFPSDYLEILKDYELGAKLLKEGYYPQSYAHLKKANDKLKYIIAQTKIRRINRQIETLQQKIDSIYNSKRNVFLSSDFDKLCADFENYKKTVDPLKFEEAKAGIDELNTKLNNIIAKADEFEESIIAKLEEKYAKYINVERIDRFAYKESQKIHDLLMYLKSDLSMKNYENAFTTYNEIKSLMNYVDELLAEKSYFENLFALLDEMQENKGNFRTVIESTPLVIETTIYENVNVKVGWSGMAGSISPYKYNLHAQKTYTKFLGLKPPSHLMDIHDIAKKVFENYVYSASVFEKLTLANYLDKETVKSLLKKAFRYNKKSEIYLDLLMKKITEFKETSPQRRDMFTYMKY